jgi:hypothetical protein
MHVYRYAVAIETKETSSAEVTQAIKLDKFGKNPELNDIPDWVLRHQAQTPED